MKDYTSYTAREFALDNYFQQWVIAPDEATRHFWETWLLQNPEKKDEVMEAKAFLQSMPFEQYELSREEDRGMWGNINSRISSAETNPLVTPAKVRQRFPEHWYRYAAVLLLPLLAGIIYYMTFSSYETFSTGYGEKQSITLPDGSLVTLNANSTLKYKDEPAQQQVREVWLNGEAFFEVKHIKRYEAGQKKTKVKFVVHTPQVDVEVLGTEFNVKHRSQSTEVVLNSGKILLKRENEAITLMPGERVKVSDVSTQLSKERVDVEVFDAWKADLFVFKNSSLKEVIDMLRDTYGYEVEIEATEMLDKRITSIAPVSTESIPIFLKMLEKLYGVKIIKSDYVIQIE